MTPLETRGLLESAMASVVELGSARPLAEETVTLARAHGRVLARDVAALPTPALHTAGRARHYGVLLRAGTVLTAARVALAAASGIPALPVSRRPTVALLLVDGGLAEPGAAAADGQRFDGTRELLVGLMRADGLEPTVWPTFAAGARDVEIAMRDTACAFDIVIVSGAGRGATEHGAPVLERFGQPAAAAGPPGVAIGRLDEAAVLVLSGPPARIAGLYLTLGRTLVDSLQRRAEARRYADGVCTAPPPYADDALFIPVWLSPQHAGHVTPVMDDGWEGLAQADAVAVVMAGMDVRPVLPLR